MSERLKDRVYIVTGGSKGFGLATASVLVERGAYVGLISRDQAGLDQAVKRSVPSKPMVWQVM